jgi:DNA-binding transcriptional LysR family regulator
MNEKIGVGQKVGWSRAMWDDLHLFLAVAREGGLSPAAKVTQRSPATLGRRMLALERSLGRELFVRHDRGYGLTSEGRTLLDDLSDVEARMIRLTTRPSVQERPLVKVSAGTWTTLALLGKLDAITGSPADIRLRFVSAESALDISHREVVIGIRSRRPTEEGLAGRKLARVEFAPYATKTAPERWIKVIGETPSARWLAKTVGNDAVCEINSPRNCLDLALAGKGIALLPTFIGDDHKTLLRAGSTVPELAHDRWIVTHQDDRHLPEIRRTIDRLCDVLQSQ